MWMKKTGIPEVIFVALLHHGDNHDEEKRHQPGLGRDWGVDHPGEDQGHLGQMFKLGLLLHHHHHHHHHNKDYCSHQKIEVGASSELFNNVQRKKRKERVFCRLESEETKDFEFGTKSI